MGSELRQCVARDLIGLLLLPFRPLSYVGAF